MNAMPTTTLRVIDCLVTSAEVGERADVALGRLIPGLSRRQARALGLAGKLEIDGRRASPSTRVALGQRLSVALDEPTNPDPLALEPLAITDRFVYVAKPAGVHTVALTPDQPGVLASAVAARWPECGEASEDPREGGAIHRLDRPTSGVVAFARSREVWLRARAGFGEGLVRKLYLAVVQPRDPSWPPRLPEGALQAWLEPSEPDEFEPLDATLQAWAGEGPLDVPVRIRAPLGRGDEPGRVAVRLDGRRATSVIQPIAESIRAGDSAPTRLVRIRLDTGLRHQARVHLAWLGAPIVGDRDYDPDHDRRVRTPGPDPKILLHAYRLDLCAMFPEERAVVATPAGDFWPPPS